MFASPSRQILHIRVQKLKQCSVIENVDDMTLACFFRGSLCCPQEVNFHIGFVNTQALTRCPL